MYMSLTFLNNFSSKIYQNLTINECFRTLDTVWSYSIIEEGV